jgi:hypothetical protein
VDSITSGGGRRADGLDSNAVSGRSAVEGVRNQLEARRHHDTFDKIPSLALPVYVFGDRYDILSMAIFHGRKIPLCGNALSHF